MTFSCTLELCLGPCNDATCGPRRKRDTDLKTKSREKRAVEELLGHSYIGNRYTVSRLTTIIKTSDPNKACVHFAIIFLLFPTLTIVAVSLVTYSLILYRSYRQQVILQSEILNSRTASNVSMGPKIEDTAI
ncbi:uncharacterized protein LOC134244500 isoform X1 [Saccostrea cucullata]|uniref:uncharacterized protein LOC134244500 isoform X1 n=1 Tax=Saccostrea cuccullata TaxID=36930 RepID=UPI002ED4E5C6